VEDDVVRQQTVQHLREFVRDDPVPASITFSITVPPCGRSMQRSALSSVARTGQPQMTIAIPRGCATTSNKAITSFYEVSLVKAILCG
jgi:hypothetical protein